MKRIVTISIDADTGKCNCECGLIMQENYQTQNFICSKCGTEIPITNIENLVRRKNNNEN